MGVPLCFTWMQAITADTLIAYITHDDRPNESSASSRHGTQRRGGLCNLKLEVDGKPVDNASTGGRTNRRMDSPKT